ncbi:hypothetical protein [Pseudoalteromonas phage J2-1_QLiu-2017]|nr:hypothetical protein [Pseudoalteromonas phage J2-1_QLiu-2017]
MEKLDDIEVLLMEVQNDFQKRATALMTKAVETGDESIADDTEDFIVSLGATVKAIVANYARREALQNAELTSVKRELVKAKLNLKRQQEADTKDVRPVLQAAKELRDAVEIISSYSQNFDTELGEFLDKDGN